jgi:hypothetical protein
MKLTNDFTIGVPVEEAWELLTDLERVAPCVPGFSLVGQDGEDFKGAMTVKVGAVSVSYDARIRFVERDDVRHVAVMEARAREKRGQGQVKAVMTSRLQAVDGATQVSVESDIDVTGRVASFGRGILADVSNRLVGLFVANVQSTLLAPPEPEPAAAPASGPVDPARPVAAASAAPLDLMSVAGAPALRRLAPVALVLLVATMVLRGRIRGRG